jgi:hypothetical protein
MPIDDMGPERSASHPDVLDLLASGFIESGYDLQWLVRTLTLTDVYQRQIRTVEPGATPFASASATRLRSDQIYNSIVTVLGGRSGSRRTALGGNMAGTGMGRRSRDPKDQFALIFGFDPSTPQADLTGKIPQALFLMNSPQINGQINANTGTRLSRIVSRFRDDQDAISELYMMVLSRSPSQSELKICRVYIAEAGNRNEAFEDLMWSLLNSSEFVSRR